MGACTPGSLLHPAFSNAPFLLDRFTSNTSGTAPATAIVHEYSAIGPQPGLQAANALGGAANRDASGAQLEGQDWRGGFTGGSSVGVSSHAPSQDSSLVAAYGRGGAAEDGWLSSVTESD